MIAPSLRALDRGLRIGNLRGRPTTWAPVHDEAVEAKSRARLRSLLEPEAREEAQSLCGFAALKWRWTTFHSASRFISVVDIRQFVVPTEPSSCR